MRKFVVQIVVQAWKVLPCQLARRMLPNCLAKLYGKTLRLGVQKIVLYFVHF